MPMLLQKPAAGHGFFPPAARQNWLDGTPFGTSLEPDGTPFQDSKGVTSRGLEQRCRGLCGALGGFPNRLADGWCPLSMNSTMLGLRPDINGESKSRRMTMSLPLPQGERIFVDSPIRTSRHYPIVISSKISEIVGGESSLCRTTWQMYDT